MTTRSTQCTKKPILQEIPLKLIPYGYFTLSERWNKRGKVSRYFLRLCEGLSDFVLYFYT